MEGKTYYLDLLMLVKSLGQQSATLNTDTLKKVTGLSGPCRGFVTVRKGEIVHCMLKEETGGKHIEGPMALHLLQTVKQWHIRFEQDEVSSPPASVSSPFHVQASYQVIPRQLRSLDPIHLEHLEVRDQMAVRMVLTMVNQRRTVEQIKAQLPLPPETVDLVLTYLRQIQVIE